MMNPETFLKVTGIPRSKMGGQELILYEILTLLDGYKTVWIPFPEGCQTLVDALVENHIVCRGRELYVAPDAVYFGTPTIVNGAPLFPGAPLDIIDKCDERYAVKKIVKEAEHWKVKRIVSGLGSGDISVKERKADMGPGTKVVVKKRFDEFTDWILVRDVA